MDTRARGDRQLVKIVILLLFSRVGGLKDVKRTFFPLHPNQG
jgi:hypothetical protein